MRGLSGSVFAQSRADWNSISAHFAATTCSAYRRKTPRASCVAWAAASPGSRSTHAPKIASGRARSPLGRFCAMARACSGTCAATAIAKPRSATPMQRSAHVCHPRFCRPRILFRPPFDDGLNGFIAAQFQLHRVLNRRVGIDLAPARKQLSNDIVTFRYSGTREDATQGARPRSATSKSSASAANAL